MKKNNSISIIGCSIPSLYAGIKCLTIGYSVTILEKNLENEHDELLSYNNLQLYNDNHETYDRLLKSYQLNGEILCDIKYNSDFFSLIETIIYKSKFIPSTILSSQNLAGLCKYLSINIDILKKYNSFDHIFNKISAQECLNIFKYDIVNTSNYYYVSNHVIRNLLKIMKYNFELKGGKIIYDSYIKNIRYVKKKFNLTSQSSSQLSVYNSDYILTTISKNNIQSFTFWNKEQRKMLNSVIAIPTSHINAMMQNILHTKFISIIDGVKNVHKLLLHDLHIVYPIISNKEKTTYLWNSNVNNVLISEKIKCMYNDKFIICSESFSKNNMFVNYSLDVIDSIIDSLIYTNDKN